MRATRQPRDESRGSTARPRARGSRAFAGAVVASLVLAASLAMGSGSGPSAVASTSPDDTLTAASIAVKGSHTAPNGVQYVTPRWDQIAWIDMAGFNATTAGTTAGQKMTVRISDRYVMTFTVRYENTVGNSRRGLIAAPAFGDGSLKYFFGGAYYYGISGSPILYQQTTPATATGGKVTLRDISISTTGGEPVNYAMVMTDGEITNDGESLKVEVDTPFTTKWLLDGYAANGTVVEGRIPACRGGETGGVGSLQYECKAGPLGTNGRTMYDGIFVIGADNPTRISGTFGNSTMSTSRQGIAFGVALATAQMTTTVASRASAGDAFLETVQAGGLGTVSQPVGAGETVADSGKKFALGTQNPNPISFSVATTNAANAAKYRADWTCTRKAANGTVTTIASATGVGLDWKPSGLTYSLWDSVRCDVVLSSTSGFVASKTANPASGTTLSAGSTVTYTVTGKNTGAADLVPVTLTDDLSGVLDDAVIVPGSIVTTFTGDGRTTTPAAVSGTTLSWTGTLAENATVSVSYQVKLKDGLRGGESLRNKLSGSATPPDTPKITPPTVETQHPVRASQWTLTKTSDKPSGAVTPGDVLTYSVTARSTDGSVADVVLTDDLADVVDDATFVKGSARLSIDGGAPVTVANPVNGKLATAPFVLPSGKTAVLTYQVTVDSDAWGAQIRNVVTGTGSTPPSGCRPGPADPACTTAHTTPFHVFVQKAKPGANGAASGELEGAEFTIHADDAGAPGAAVLPSAAVPGSVGLIEATGLLPGTYWIVETKAPIGHELLAAPVAFVVARDGAVSLADPARDARITVDGVTITIVDAKTLPLPAAGGSGSLPYVVGGAALLLVAFAGLLLAAFANLLPWRRSVRGRH